MSVVTHLLNQYASELQIIQKEGIERYNNGLKHATSLFKAKRSELAENYGQELLHILFQEPYSIQQLYWVSEITHCLSQIPAQQNSGANVLSTFSYQFLCALNDRIWGFPEDLNERLVQQKCSTEIVFAICGKQDSDTRAGGIQPSNDLVCVALQYLFICQHQSIFNSRKHNNVKKLIDEHFKLNKNSLIIAFDSLYNRLNYQDQKIFISLMSDVSFQFINEEIVKIFFQFEQSKISEAKMCDPHPHFANTLFYISSLVLSGAPESFGGNETAVDTSFNSKISQVNDEIINPIKNEMNAYGAIEKPRKEVEVMPIIHKENQSETSSVSEKNNSAQQKYDLGKIIWGAPSCDEIRDEQIEYFKQYLLNNKNIDAHMSLCIAVQFSILVKNGNKTIQVPAHWKLVMTTILLQRATSLSKALVFIENQLTTHDQKIDFMQILSKVAYSFRENKYAPYYRAFTSYQKKLETDMKVHNENNNNASGQFCGHSWKLPKKSINNNNNIIYKKPYRRS